MWWGFFCLLCFLFVCFSSGAFQGPVCDISFCLVCVVYTYQTSKWMDGNSLLWQGNPLSPSHSASRWSTGGQAVKHFSACLFALSSALEIPDPCSACLNFINEPSHLPISNHVYEQIDHKYVISNNLPHS